MISKTTGIIFCIIMMLSVVAVAEPTQPMPREKITINDDVPTWNIDDSWTYTINDFTINISKTGKKIFIDGRIDDLKWTVKDTTGDTYRVDFTGNLSAEYEIYTSSPVTLNVMGNFKPSLTHLTGTIYFTKSGLEIEDVSANIIGITVATISPIPIPLPIPFKLTVDGDLSTVFPLFDFPLHALKSWALPDINVEMNAQFGGIFGLIKIPITFQTHYSGIPFAFWCWNKQSITVEAGTFDAWKISTIISDYFEYYYAPSIGNLIKLDIDLTNGDVHGELKSTNIPH
ncbi:MAG: hypothetical protein JSW60_01345 [Thermoplasmatales archaeon]|nr:MAG: hypothetical protein JSW60_01345 [Thermoplasmatales archaeon]